MNIIYYGASWCGPCKQTLPIVRDHCAENEIEIEFFDVDEHYTYAQQNDVRAVPTIDFYRSGSFVHRHTGAITKSALRRLIAELDE